MAASGRDWDLELFKARPEVLQTAAGRFTVNGEQDVKGLLREITVKIEANQRTTRTLRWVYQVLTAGGVDSWAEVSAGYDLWYQDQPRIRVRVSNPDGSIHHLSPATLVETGGDQGSGPVFSDRRNLRAPIPGLTIGSVVEEEVVIPDRRPFFEAGLAGRYDLIMGENICSFRLIFEVDNQLPFQFRVEGADIKPVVTRQGRRTVYTFTHKGPRKPAEAENNLPPGQAAGPGVAYSTGTDWTAVASRYSQWVEEAARESRVLVPEGIKGLDLRSASLKLVRWINERVRYTGLELGEQSIAPTKPEEVLARKYGDCKDKATLLACLLRQAGFPAVVALLRASAADDINPVLPGLGRMNHAIVMVPGDPGVWIDPTDEFSREGMLPAGDCNRWALVCSPGGGLKKTTALSTNQNVTTRTRVFSLHDAGYANVTETYTYQGVAESINREHYAGFDKENGQEQIQNYIDNNFRFGKPAGFDFPDPRNLDQPFELTLTIEKCGRGITEDYTAVAAIMQADLLSGLPDALRSAEEDDQPRQHPFYLHAPLANELVYLIHPPRGFTARPLPANSELQMGPSRLIRNFSLDAGGTVRARLRFDAVQQEFTVPEYLALRQGILNFLKEEPILINFEHEGEKLLNEDKYGDAFEVFRRLALEEPANPRHAIRLARALLRAGLGDPAKRVITETAKRHPDSRPVQSCLGWILQHDRFGRRFEEGWDREGAIAAYEKAAGLDGEEAEDLYNQAIVLEHSPDGQRYGPEADLAAAIACYRQGLARAAKNDQLKEDDTFYYNLIIDLLRSGKAPEIEEPLKQIKKEDSRQLFRLIATVLCNGVEATLAEAARISPANQQRRVISETADFLLKMRRYRDCAILLRAAAKGAENANQLETRADMIGRLVPWTELSYDTSAPDAFIRHIFRKLFTTRNIKPRDLAADCVPDLLAGDDEKNNLSPSMELQRLFMKIMHQQEINWDMLVDVILANLTIKKTGSPETGYRLEVVSMQQDMTITFYVISHGRTFLLAGASKSPETLGWQILEFIRQGKTQAARQWLDWILEDMPSLEPGDPLSGHPFVYLWDKSRPDTPRLMEIAAASLINEGRHAAEALTLLEDLRSSVTDSGLLKGIDKAQAITARELKKNPILLQASQRLYRHYPDSFNALILLNQALLTNNRAAEAVTAVREWSDRHPGQFKAGELLASTLIMNGDLAGTREYLSQLAAKETAGASDYNNLAWLELFVPRNRAESITFSRKAVQLSEKKSAYLNTLAALYAEDGRCGEALKLLYECLNDLSGDRPQPSDWLVYGLIAWQCGDLAEAASAFQRVKEDAGQIFPSPTSAYRLARLRLQALEGQKGFTR